MVRAARSLMRPPSRRLSSNAELAAVGLDGLLVVG